MFNAVVYKTAMPTVQHRSNSDVTKDTTYLTVLERLLDICHEINISLEMKLLLFYTLVKIDNVKEKGTK